MSQETMNIKGGHDVHRESRRIGEMGRRSVVVVVTCLQALFKYDGAADDT